MSKQNVYTVISTRYRTGAKSEFTGTISELVEMFAHTLACGASCEHEKWNQTWNQKIDRNPKTIKSLIMNLNNATSNTGENCSPSTFITYERQHEES